MEAGQSADSHITHAMPHIISVSKDRDYRNKYKQTIQIEK